VPAVRAPPAPRRCGPAGGSQPPGQLAPEEAPEPRRGETPEPHGARLAARLRLGAAAAGSRPLQATGPRLIHSAPVDKMLRALPVELGLDRADELPELWLGHYEFDSSA
ncbi:CITE1 protein, partial [Drymodes brunneopygia]|nr:CITE1 protein [Drymodes brunneopygia]